MSFDQVGFVFQIHEEKKKYRVILVLGENIRGGDELLIPDDAIQNAYSRILEFKMKGYKSTWEKHKMEPEDPL